MMHSCKRWLMAAVLCLPALAAAQSFPDKPVRLVVAYTPGGATDVIARILAARLTEKWQQQVVVENKAGAGGMIGAEQVVQARPDGYTLLLAYTPEVSINKLIYKQMRYDPLTDLLPIARVAQAPLVLVSGPKLPVRDYRAFLALGKERQVSYGSPGTGGQQHLAGELLKLRSGMNLLHIPYRGTSAAVADLVGGQIDVFFATAPALMGHIRSGKLHPLLIAGPDRQGILPDTPTAAEVGLADFDISNWFGVFAPAKMDAGLAARLSGDVADVLRQPDTAKALTDQGLTVAYLDSAGFRAFIGTEMTKYAGIIELTGVPRQ